VPVDNIGIFARNIAAWIHYTDYRQLVPTGQIEFYDVTILQPSAPYRMRRGGNHYRGAVCGRG
jgi:hypothetical protein